MWQKTPLVTASHVMWLGCINVQ